MTLMHTRLFLLVTGFGLFVGCGKDEQVSSLIDGRDSDAGSTGSTPGVSPTSGNSTTSAAVSPTVNPVSPGPATSKLAAACASDAECGTGMKCLTAGGTGMFGGGPANGFCTKTCDQNDVNSCASVQSGAMCIGVSERDWYCFPGCSPGGASATKCQGRAEVACDNVSLSSAFCRPMCGSDADCDGRKCNLGTGVCVDDLLGTGEIGDPCDPNEVPSTQCASGRCLRGETLGTENTGTCTGYCTLGTDTCGVQGRPKGGQAACFPLRAGSSTGDMGVCWQSCDCDDQCGHEDYQCLTFPAAAVATYGVEGLCSEFDVDTEGLADDGFVLGRMCEVGSDAGAGVSDASVDAATDASSIPDSVPDAANDAAMSIPLEAAAPDSSESQADAN